MHCTYLRYGKETLRNFQGSLNVILSVCFLKDLRLSNTAVLQ